MKEWQEPQLKILGVNDTTNGTYEMGPLYSTSKEDDDSSSNFPS